MSTENAVGEDQVLNEQAQINPPYLGFGLICGSRAGNRDSADPQTVI
jgi:hypothetical protein